MSTQSDRERDTQREGECGREKKKKEKVLPPKKRHQQPTAIDMRQRKLSER